MKVQLQLLNVMCYTNKETNLPNTRLGYVFVGKECLQETEKFKGFQEQASYFDNNEVFNKITSDLIGKTCVAVIKEVPNSRNPLKVNRVISELNFENGKTIHLL